MRTRAWRPGRGHGDNLKCRDTIVMRVVSRGMGQFLAGVCVEAQSAVAGYSLSMPRWACQAIVLWPPRPVLRKCTTRTANVAAPDTV